MITLNLEANGIEQQKLKEYLENNASEILADKINNGVKITKYNKTLINKKDLKGFWKFATDEARKIAEKGTNGTFVDDATVYGWLIHYFEEDSIEGNLYNEDGTEYKVEVKATPKSATKVEKTKKQESNQQTLFDLMNVCEDEPEADETEDDDIDEITEEEIEEVLEKTEKEQQLNVEINEIKQEENSIDKELAIMLYQALNGNLEVK